MVERKAFSNEGLVPIFVQNFKGTPMFKAKLRLCWLLIAVFVQEQFSVAALVFAVEWFREIEDLASMLMVQSLRQSCAYLKAIAD